MRRLAIDDPLGLARPRAVMTATVGRAVPAPAVWVGWLLGCVAAANALFYPLKAANPLVISDGWYFLDSFVRKAVEGSLTLGDFFQKRSAIDHSQPFHKLLLVANVHFFDMDFMLDAMVGLAFGLLTLLLIRTVIRRSAGPAFATVAVQAGFVAICAVFLSLNGTAVFEWPLVTMGYLALFVLVALFIAAWQACERGRYAWLLVWGCTALLVADDGGVIGVLAAILALALLALKGCHRRRALVAAALLVVSIVVYKIGYDLLAPAYAPAAILPGVRQLFATPDLGMHVAHWIAAPLSASVLHPEQSRAVLGARSGLWDAAVAVTLTLLHVWFWWRVLQRRPSLASHVASCTMLLFYGLVAGVLLVRVPAFGDRSFNEPRYIIFYQLNLVALLLMAIDSCAKAVTPFGGRRARAALLVASLALVLVQLPAARAGWQREPFQRRYVEQLAGQLQELAANPSVAAPHCLPLLTVCKMPAARRRELVSILQSHHLNLFSDEFRHRHAFAAPAPQGR